MKGRLRPVLQNSTPIVMEACRGEAELCSVLHRGQKLTNVQQPDCAGCTETSLTAMQRAANESKTVIEQALAGTDMVFVTVSAVTWGLACL